MGQAKGGTGTGMMREGFRDKAFTYSFRQAWTDRCTLLNNWLYCLCFP